MRPYLHIKPLHSGFKALRRSDVAATSYSRTCRQGLARPTSRTVRSMPPTPIKLSRRRSRIRRAHLLRWTQSSSSPSCRLKRRHKGPQRSLSMVTTQSKFFTHVIVCDAYFSLVTLSIVNNELLIYKYAPKSAVRILANGCRPVGMKHPPKANTSWTHPWPPPTTWTRSSR